MRIRKAAGYVQVPRELLLDAGAIEPTPDERAEMDRRHAESQVQQAERDAIRAAGRQALEELTDPLTRAILGLHRQNERGECEGDDMDGYDAIWPEWPCRTVQAVAEHHGIELGDW